MRRGRSQGPAESESLRAAARVVRGDSDSPVQLGPSLRQAPRTAAGKKSGLRTHPVSTPVHIAERSCARTPPREGDQTDLIQSLPTNGGLFWSRQLLAQGSTRGGDVHDGAFRRLKS